MPPDMTSTDRGAIPTLSVQSLHRPLIDEEMLQLWGDQWIGSRNPDLNELERILQEGDEQDRTLVEACISYSIFQAIQARMLHPDDGHLPRFGNTLREAVDRFNRYLR